MLKPTPLIVCLSAIVTLLVARVCQGQDFSMTKEFRSESVDRASQMLIDRYVFPEIGEQAAERLLSQKANGDFDRFNTLDSFAQALTDSIYAVTKDKHLTVSRRRFGDQNNADANRIASLLAQRRDYRRSNAGFVAVEKLEGNVGYLKLTGFYGLDLGKPHADRAVAFLSTSDAIVIDLRENRGGRGEMADYLLSYFFSNSIVTSKTTKRIGQRFVENINRTQIQPENKVLAEVPLFVLLSSETISAAEGFSFPLKIFKRATFVGEVSAGAANPGDLIPLNDQLQLFVSDVSVTHPSDGSTWEGIGIVPDVACDSEEALEIALNMAQNAAHDFNVSNERRATDAVAHLDRVQRTFDSETSTELVVDAYLECKRHGIFFSEWELNRLGYERLGEPAKTKLGEAILRANSVLHPDSANVFDSYGDALSASGDLKQALYNYRKAVEIGTPQDHENLEQFKANVKRIEQELSTEDGVSGGNQAGNQAGNNTECNIDGTCIGVENQSIVLMRPADDPRHDKLVEHPIINGEFKAVIKLTHPECFLLAFGDEVKTGAYRTMVVFLEPGAKVELTVHPQTEFEKNTIEGCELNREYSQYLSDFDTRFGGQERSLWKKQDDLVQLETRHRAAIKKLEAERSQKDSTDLQRKAEELDLEGKSLSISRIELANEYRTTNQKISNWRLDYVLEKRSLVSYYLLYDDVLQNGPDIEDVESLREASEKFADKYPSHPYTLALKALLDGLSAKRVGQRFIDFSAPDLDGIDHRLSDEIKGKVALIDLWATWCGPCIVKSRKMIPIYNEFKTDGFTVVGVAGEYDNTSNLEAFLKRENFPWLNLVELDRQNRIWEKYGVHGGGEKILVDESGIILAIDPSADELNAILSKRYR